MSFTYKDLAERIAAMTPEQLNSDVTVYVTGVDEYYPLLKETPVVDSDPEVNDQLDPGHPYLVI
jgi:hypothetical protein